MPELPEVETVKRGITNAITNQVVMEIIVRDRRLRYQVASEFESELTGCKLTRVVRRAKYLIINTDSPKSIIIHLGMSGKLRILPDPTPAVKHDHIDVRLANGHILRYNDPRRFGFWLWTANPLSHKLLSKLGPEPLSVEFSDTHLIHFAHKRSVSIKQFIMDNSMVVGVGNIYANEALFVSGIHPQRLSSNLTIDELTRLHQAIKQVIAKAIDAGGTTLKDFYSADGSPGYFSQELQVYGREGKSCNQCDQKIASMVIGQRRSFYCPSCQT